MPSHPMKAGVLGWPIGHSLSPRLHAFWLKQYGLDGSYEALAVEPVKLAATLHGMANAGFSGVNLTVPHKIAAIEIVDVLTPVAGRVGAVNLVTVEKDGRLVGNNTDAYGFAQNVLNAGFLFNGGAAFVLGAGGAAHAVIVALQDLGFKDIRVSNRTRAHAEEVAQLLMTPQCRIEVVDWGATEKLSDVEILVNTTSLGLTGQPPLNISLEMLPNPAWVSDIVYRPLETALLRNAKARGHRTVDGLGMLLHQARPSFTAFFGHDPEVTSELRAHVLAGMAS